MGNRKALQTPRGERFEDRRRRPLEVRRGFWEWLFGGYYRGG